MNSTHSEKQDRTFSLMNAWFTLRQDALDDLRELHGRLCRLDCEDLAEDLEEVRARLNRRAPYITDGKAYLGERNFD